MKLIDADFITKELGATCIAKRDERGKLIPLGSINDIPTVNPLNVGKWEYKKLGISTCAILCSKCGSILHKGENYTDVTDYRRSIQQMLKDKGIGLDNFCAVCGADMRERDTE